VQEILPTIFCQRILHISLQFMIYVNRIISTKQILPSSFIIILFQLWHIILRIFIYLQQFFQTIIRNELKFKHVNMNIHKSFVIS